MNLIDAARLCEAAYGNMAWTPATAAPVPWNSWVNVDGIVGALWSSPGMSILALRGTTDTEDLIRDIDAVPISVPGLGDVHSGFYAGIDAFFATVQPLLTGSVVVSGHSLGASRAVLLGAKLCLAGKPPAQILGFEPAKVSADAVLGQLLGNVNVQLTKNGGDIIPDLPEGLDYRHPVVLELIGVPALPNLVDHEIANVLRSLGG